MNQLQAIAYHATKFLAEEKDIQQYETSVFPAVTKVAKIAHAGYSYFTKDDLQKFIDKCAREFAEQNDFVVSYVNDRSSFNSLFGFDTNTNLILPDNTFATTQEVEKRLLAIHEKSLSPHICNSTVFRYHAEYNGIGIECNTAMITEEKTQSYAGIPPLAVIHAANKAKEHNLFDSFVVIDAKNVNNKYILKEKIPPVKEIQAQRRKMIDDPILCGKIDQMPDVYFTIAGWDKDLDMSSILKQ